MKTPQMCVVLLIAASGTMYADESTVDTHSHPYTFKPLLMDGSNNSGTVLGVEYGLYKEWSFLEDKPKPTGNANFEPIDNGKGFGLDHGFVRGEAHGIWTADEDKNPKNLATADVSLGYSIFRIKDSLELAAKAGIEGNQNYDNNHKVYSGQLLGYHAFTNDASTYLEFLLGYGQVDASNDDTRKALTDKTKFDRANGEVYLNFLLPKLDGDVPYAPNRIGFNYRYFKEINAPTAVEDAKQDEFQYGGVHLSFEKGFYLAYTVGKLPFDEKNDRVFSIGFSQNLF